MSTQIQRTNSSLLHKLSHSGSVLTLGQKSQEKGGHSRLSNIGVSIPPREKRPFTWDCSGTLFVLTLHHLYESNIQEVWDGFSRSDSRSPCVAQESGVRLDGGADDCFGSGGQYRHFQRDQRRAAAAAAVPRS